MDVFHRSRRWLSRYHVYGLSVIIAALVLAACSSNNNKPAPSPGATFQRGVATRAASQPAAAQAPATTARPALPAAPATATGAAAAPAAGTAAAGAAQAVQAQIVEPKGANGSSDPQTWTYTPNQITVPVGGSITWTNTGLASHTVTADDEKSFDSGAIQRGDTWTFTFKTAGTFAYHCTFHNWMKGTVTVGG